MEVDWYVALDKLLRNGNDLFRALENWNSDAEEEED